MTGNPGHGETMHLDTDHRGMNKFSSANDPNFVRFMERFSRAFFKATEDGMSHFLLPRQGASI